MHHAKRKEPPNVSISEPENRHGEPNRLATYTTALQKQHKILLQSISELERDLDLLNMTMAQKSDTLDHERWALHMELEKVRTKDTSIRTIEFEMTYIRQLKTAQSELFNDATSTTGTTESKGKCIEMVMALRDFFGHQLDTDTKIKVRRVAECDVAMYRLLQSNEQLSGGIEANIMKLKNIDNSEIEIDEKNTLERLRHRIESSHKDLIMSDINLESQIVAVQVLEKEMGKLNGLPQILPILRSSIKDYEDVIKKDRQAIARLDSDRLSPCISDATDLFLKAVAKAQGQRFDTETINNVETYDKIIKLLLEQAAANQLLLYILEVEEELLNERTDHQRAFLLDVEELAKQIDPSLYDRDVNSNDEEESFLNSFKQILSMQIKGADDMLDDMMDSQQDDIPAIELLDKLKNEIKGANGRTESSMADINEMMLESENALEMMEKFSQVYINDQESDTHIPEETLQLHEQLENFVNDLQNEIQHFQKETATSAELAEKKRRFSLFWTDQSLFQKEFGSM
ncbi:hypothetical protein INT44_006264 [Umbelopsis vinacea]|uniref:Uncharacterized protein n=1 Tax=Umbelopsis vinacea TaxID=44442 RepID=A0A8H7PSK3_9FUNG|nr:hypothetical protein INT44_006264 [Umbelopsis vinacea]